MLHRSKIKTSSFLIILLLTSIAAEKPLSNRQMEILAAKKLEHYPNAPAVLGFSVYSDRAGKNCRLDVLANRNRVKGHLIMAFYALAEITPNIKRPLKNYIVCLHFNQHDRRPEFWISEAEKVRDCFIHQTLDLKTWLDQHLYQIQL